MIRSLLIGIAASAVLAFLLAASVAAWLDRALAGITIGGTGS